MTGKYKHTKIDAIPNLLWPACLFMLATAMKSVVIFLVAASVAVLFNIPSIFQGDPFWRRRERVVVALLAIPICISLFFWIHDLAAQTLTILITMLCYGILVVFIESWDNLE